MPELRQREMIRPGMVPGRIFVYHGLNSSKKGTREMIIAWHVREGDYLPWIGRVTRVFPNLPGHEVGIIGTRNSGRYPRFYELYWIYRAPRRG